MWGFLANGEGTHYYDGFALLDQIMVSKSILTKKSGLGVVAGSTCIEKFPAMTKNGKPVRFSRPSEKGFTSDGYSDHFPVSVELGVEP
jgi:hypothetical protein